MRQLNIMSINYKTQYTVKITPEHQEFMNRLVDSQIFESKADVARHAMNLVMKEYPEHAEGLPKKHIDRRTSSYRNAHPRAKKE